MSFLVEASRGGMHIQGWLCTAVQRLQRLTAARHSDRHTDRQVSELYKPNECVFVLAVVLVYKSWGKIIET